MSQHAMMTDRPRSINSSSRSRVKLSKPKLASL